jgi:hypothetical protein
MTEYLNQHFVPQFYFKLFTGGTHRVHVLLKKEHRIIINASIKGQCARHKFYGNRKIESLLSKLEIRQSIAIRKMLELAWSELSDPLNITEIASDISGIWEAVLFQRARTELQIKKESPAMELMYLKSFEHYIEHAPNVEDREQILEGISSGAIRINDTPQNAVMRSIDTAFKNALLLTDLNFYIIRNHTDYPFIFGDSPVVFYNTYYQNVKCRGVLGVQTPGLQVFYPLNSGTVLMLIDDQIYGGWYKQSLFIDLVEKSDVSQLNALQLHHSYNSIYFAYEGDQEYVSELWAAHKHRVIKPEVRYVKRDGWLVDGEPTESLYQMYEPQLNIKLNLSFIECKPISESEYKVRKRSPELVEELEKTIEKQVN